MPESRWATSCPCGQDHRAVFVAGEIVALRFDAQNIADRAGGHALVILVKLPVTSSG